MTHTSEPTFLIFTDGACLGNPGPGGWAALILSHGGERVISGHETATTSNQRMELTAAIKALEALPAGSSATLHSDSQYVVKGISEWLHGWRANGWQNAAKKPVANRDLWELLDNLNADRLITWRWVRGHAGHEHNERVDRLANTEAAIAAGVVGWAEGFRYGFKRV